MNEPGPNWSKRELGPARKIKTWWLRCSSTTIELLPGNPLLQARHRRLSNKRLSSIVVGSLIGPDCATSHQSPFHQNAEELHLNINMCLAGVANWVDTQLVSRGGYDRDTYIIAAYQEPYVATTYNMQDD